MLRLDPTQPLSHLSNPRKGLNRGQIFAAATTTGSCGSEKEVLTCGLPLEEQCMGAAWVNGGGCVCVGCERWWVVTGAEVGVACIAQNTALA